MTEDIKAVRDTVGAREVLRIRSQHIVDKLSVVSIVVRHIHHQLILNWHKWCSGSIARIKFDRTLPT